MNLLSTRLLLVAALLASAAQANAGVLATSAGTYHGNWHGSSPFQGYFPSSVIPTALTGYVDFAVYAPGNFPGGFGGYTPTIGEYVYAYQAFETGLAPLSTVTLNLINPADNVGTFSGGGVNGDATIFASLTPFDNANWLFDGVAQGGSTVGLVFSSPFAPMLSTGSTIDDGSVGQVFNIPTPSSLTVGPDFPGPEPSTLVLALCGFFAIGLYRLRRWSRNSI